MKFLIVLSLLAFAYSLPTVGKNVNIGEDGTITITEVNGKRIVISKGVDQIGNKHIEISVDGPSIPSKKIKILDESYPQKEDYTEEYNREKRSAKKTSSYSSSDILTEIFKELEGPMDEKSYSKLLKKLQKEVDAGQVNPEILKIVQELSEQVHPGTYDQQFVSPLNVLTQKQLYDAILSKKLAGIEKSPVAIESKNLWVEYLKGLLQQKIAGESQYENGIWNSRVPVQETVYQRYPTFNGIWSGIPTNEFVPQRQGSELSPALQQVLLKQQYENELLQRYANAVPQAAQSTRDLDLSVGKNVPVYQFKVSDVSSQLLPSVGIQHHLYEVPSYQVGGRYSWPVDKTEVQSYLPVGERVPEYQWRVADASSYTVQPSVGLQSRLPVSEMQGLSYPIEDQYRRSTYNNEPVYQWVQPKVQSRWPVSERSLPLYQLHEEQYVPVATRTA